MLLRSLSEAGAAHAKTLIATGNLSKDGFLVLGLKAGLRPEGWVTEEDGYRASCPYVQIQIFSLLVCNWIASTALSISKK